WALLNEPIEVEALTAADVVLSAPAALRILGPKVARRALEFIADGTIRPTPVDKTLLDGEPSSPAVDAVGRAVEQVSRNAQPTAVVAALLSTMMTGVQTLAAIAQQQPVGAARSPTKCHQGIAIPDGNCLWSLKIGVLREVHPCAGLVIDFPGKESISSDDDDDQE
uniref:Uncharacterized protein n=1 Tax=Romanomermis culicivorax TaxID=13658 RepID=A0A915J9Y8_ROMCU